MRYNVYWSYAAARDLESIIDFIALRNPERSKIVFEQIKRQAAALSQHPLRARLVPELKAIGLDLYRELLMDSYRALFRIYGREVVILGFFDGRRDLEEVLFERLTRI